MAACKAGFPLATTDIWNSCPEPSSGQPAQRAAVRVGDDGAGRPRKPWLQSMRSIRSSPPAAGARARG